MSADWPELTIEELKAPSKNAIAMGPFGSRIKAENFVEVGVPVIKGGNLNGDFILEDKYDYLTDEKATELKTSNAFRKDIVITHRGTIGQVGIIPDNSKFERYVVSQSQLKVTLDQEKVNPYFVYYFLRSPLGQHRLLLNASQVGVPAIAQASTSVKGILVPCPAKDIQDQIVDILLNLDHKIELNRQTNQTLEHMAQAIFKSWFVDFEPTRAKAHARAQIAKGFVPTDVSLENQTAQPLPKNFTQTDADQMVERAAMAAISGKPLSELENLPADTLAQLKITAALFPETLVDSELGEIPEGWGTQTLEDIIELAYGKALKKTDRIEGEYPVYGSGGLTGTHNKALVEGPGIIVGRKGTVGALYWEDESFFPIDTVFYVRCKNETTLVYAYYLLQTLGLEDMNTDAAVPGLNRNNAYRLEVVKPSKDIVLNFSSMVEGFRDKLSINKKEILSLEIIRSSLLPKLLSGELGIKQ